MNTSSQPARVMPALSLRANFRWTFLGNVVNAACQWGMLTVLAKLGSAADLGKFALGLAIAAPVVTVAMMQLRLVQATDTGDRYAFADYFGTRAVMTALGMLAIIAIAWLTLDDATTRWIVILVGLGKCVECISEIVRGLFQRHERMDLSGLSLIIKGPLSLTALALPMAWGSNLTLSTAALAGAGVLTLAFYDLRQAGKTLRINDPSGGNAPSLRPNLDLGVIGRMVWHAMPLAIGMCLLSLQTNIPRYVLKAYSDEQALGYFTALSYVAVLGTMVVSALGQSASPRLAAYFTDNPAAYKRLVKKLLGIGGVLGVLYVSAVMVAGKPALTLLYRPEYAAYQSEFVVLSFAGAVSFLTFFLGYALTATRVFRYQLLAGVLSSVTAVIAAFLLIPGHGIGGAAVTTLVTSLVTLACYASGVWIILRRREESVRETFRRSPL